jgi:hypothetical protein
MRTYPRDGPIGAFSYLLAPRVFVITSNALALSDCLNIQWTT